MPLRRALSQFQVIAFIALAGVVLVAAPPLTVWLKQSRKVEPDLAADAKTYLQKREFKPLKLDLNSVLEQAPAHTLRSLPHPLLGQPAPAFELSDHTARTQTLADHCARGPVVVVFYYGYYCNHCVAQLFALEDDISKFRELGAEVLAISPDTPQETSDKFGKYGRFTFPVLSDPGNKIATAYSLYQQKSSNQPKLQLHGTFVVDQQGIIRWCHYGDAPFTNNAALLVEIAEVLGRLPPNSPASE